MKEDPNETKPIGELSISPFIGVDFTGFSIASCKDALLDKNGVRIRQVDGDLYSYLEYNQDIFSLEDIANIHAEVPGHNDESSWYWIVELKSGEFALTSAWCDETGWGCHSGGESMLGRSAIDVAMYAPENEDGRLIRKNLLAQLSGEQPFGLEVNY